MSLPSMDAKAVVVALGRLTTQVRRIADALMTPVVRVGDGVTTTADDGLSYRLAQERNAAALHRQGLISDRELNAVFAATDAALAAEPCAQHPHAPVIGGHCGGCTVYPADMRPAPAADEDALRTARRDSARVILDRAARGIALRSDEATLLRQHFEAETREHDTARSVAAGNKRHVQTIVPELEHHRAGHEAWKEKAEEQRRRADQLEELLRVAHETSNRSETERAAAVQRADQADAVTAETKRLLERRTTTLRERAERAEAAIERVREVTARRLADDECSETERRGYHSALVDVRRALDGTEQPTTKA